MRICVAPNSFKESLTAVEAAAAIERGLREAEPGCDVVSVPVADGGGGTASAMVHATGGRMVKASVTGPLGDPVEAEYGLLGGGTAVIEMASASGLQLLPPGKRNPLITTTFGTGELIGAALDAGARTIIIGIGGSATVDGGVGMTQALGGSFLGAGGQEIPRGGGGLAALERIDLSRLDHRLRESRIEIACDVDNLLTGPDGAAPVYGPQKGATPADVQQLSLNLERLARVIKRDVGIDVEHLRGGGAAGGLGAGLVAFLGARLRPGAEIVIEAVRLEEKMQGCDLVITGEGKLDQQTLHGKAPAGVVRLARKLGIPVIVLAGCIGEERAGLNDAGIGAYFSTTDCAMSLEDAMKRAPELLASAAEQAFRAFLLGRGECHAGKAQRRFILASASPERKKLLADLGLSFDVIPAEIDEKLPGGMPPREAAAEIARRKARAAARIAAGRGIVAVVIAADTIVVAGTPETGEEVIGKPQDDAHAEAILRQISGSRHSVVSGLCVLDMATGRELVGWDDTRIKMARMTDSQIREYVASGEPRGKSGAYGFQERNDPYVEEITGSFSNVLGLPLELLREFLVQIEQSKNGRKKEEKMKKTH